MSAYVKNLAKNGDFYWVFANVTASLDNSGNIIGYYSVRRKPSKKGIEAVEGLYSELLQVEKSQGLEASGKALENKLNEMGVDYDELAISLQK